MVNVVQLLMSILFTCATMFVVFLVAFGVGEAFAFHPDTQMFMIHILKWLGIGFLSSGAGLLVFAGLK